MNYYYADANSQQIGPFTVEQMQELYHQGTIHENSWVIMEGETEWNPFASVVQLSPVPPSDKQAPLQPPANAILIAKEVVKYRLNENAVVHATASLESAVVDRLKKGTVVTVGDKIRNGSESWDAVTLADDRQGYIPGKTKGARILTKVNQDSRQSDVALKIKCSKCRTEWELTSLEASTLVYICGECKTAITLNPKLGMADIKRNNLRRLWRIAREMLIAAASTWLWWLILSSLSGRKPYSGTMIGVGWAVVGIAGSVAGAVSVVGATVELVRKTNVNVLVKFVVGIMAPFLCLLLFVLWGVMMSMGEGRRGSDARYIFHPAIGTYFFIALFAWTRRR